MHVRAFRTGDAEATYRVFHDAVHQGAAGWYTPEERQVWAPSAAMPDGWPDRLGSVQTRVAEADGAVVGFMSLTGANREAGHGTGHLDMAYVAPDWQGRGVADALLDAVLAEAARRGMTRLTTDASHLARRFLLRRGWTEDRRQEVLRRGVRLTNFRMSVTL